MRLLKLRDDGSLAFTEDLITNIPRYAILSHTWGHNNDEVTFKDILQSTGGEKEGYRKIEFCRKQAARDGLDHFWVDTCCIDKTNNTELSEAINSMFRWYKNATKCYVYLTDVSSDASHVKNPYRSTWELNFQTSRWFRRGWTLQELIAPEQVDFFSKEGVHLGNKRSLERVISDITDIPAKVLRGDPLSQCTVAERMAWAERRETTKPEDKAYSLLGVFNVQMALLYGEGEEKALRRLREETTKALKGVQHQDFSVTFSLHGVPEIERFVAREQELAEMQETLRTDGSRRVVVLHGLGGIGKTQLAIAYAKRFRDNYSAVFWLNIEDENTLKQSFVNMAKQIRREHPSAIRSSVGTGENLDEVIDAVKEWLSLPNNTRWLLIYDNYDNPKLSDTTDPAAIDILKYLPEAYQGSVVITTRSSQVKFGHAMRMGKLGNIHDCLEILSTTSKHKELIHDPGAINLAEELDGLPLALATAGAYLEQTSMSFQAYLRLYKDSWARLQITSPRLSTYNDRILYSTWQLSFNQIKERNENSAKFLRLWGYFGSQDIWLELLQHTDLDDPKWVKEVTKDDLSFNKTIRTLSDYGLVEVSSSLAGSTESGGYSVHSCVHTWMTHVLNHEWDEDLARFAVKCVASHIPSEESSEWWITQRRLLQHVGRCSRFILDYLTGDDMAWACFNLAYLYSSQAKLNEAEEMYRRALQSYEKVLGPDHTSTLNTVNNLGVLYWRQDKLNEAEEMYQRALQGRERALGPDHTSTLDIVNNIGVLYWRQDKLNEAEEMYQRALQGRERALGPDHTSTLDIVNNIGVLYWRQGKLNEAEEMYQRALQGRERAFGPNHTLTLRTVKNLGSLYRDQGKLIEAEVMFRRALQGLERTLGSSHPTTQIIRGNLQQLLVSQGSSCRTPQHELL
ncbi:kinesin light chain [Xylariaceae sp. AK1471]|nr:kinesin light chain [Xylariaceae sp. AK1471]